MGRNEAAERLRQMFEGFIEPDDLHRDLDKALATERRLTVERVRQRMFDWLSDEALSKDYAFHPSMFTRILDDLATADVDEEPSDG